MMQNELRESLTLIMTCNLHFHFTGFEHFLMTFVNSDITMSTHFTAGVLSFSICRFTIASNAISGVKRPTLF